MQSTTSKQVADVFLRRHRGHVILTTARRLAVLTVAGIADGICLVSCLKGSCDVRIASLVSVVFLFVAWITYRSIRDCLRVRIVPYFEKRIGGVKTVLAGKNLFLHSRQLDELAGQFGVRPLSDFASGDDLVRGEVLQWYSADDALRTLDRLLLSDATASLPSSVCSDLSLIREALNMAVSTNTRFCFLLREGSAMSGAELDKRQGSFF